MQSQLRRFSRLCPWTLSLAVVWGTLHHTGSAQEIIVLRTTEVAPPLTPTKSPGPMSLDACISLGMQHQPSLDAARASLAAAQSGMGGLDNFPLLARPFVPDLRVRKQQACEGITIAEAALAQAEWDARYAITRNFFTVQYIRSQQRVIDGVLRDLDTGYKRAEKLYKSGEADVKITKIDLDAIKIQTSIVKTKKAQADSGMLTAIAALREAMGLKYDYPLEIAVANLPPVGYSIDKDALITAALANRGELIQANAFSRVVDLERQAQQRIWGPQGRTFALGSDPHVQPIPQGIMNGEYRPGAIGPEMPPMVTGRKPYRIARVTDLFNRSVAVVDKAMSLISLDVEAQYLKWQKAVSAIDSLTGVQKLAREMPDRVQKLTPKDFTSTAVIQATTTAIMVQTQLNDEMHNHALALAGLERATAGAFRVYPAASK